MRYPLKFLAKKNYFSSNSDFRKWRAFGYNVAISPGGIVYKAYRQGTHSSPEGYSEFLPKSQNLATLPVDMNAKVIRYKAIVGKHFATNTNEVLAIVKKLEHIHKKGKVHGDLRQANVVYNHSQPELSDLIDYDYIHYECYPDFFNEVDDAMRHGGATGGAQKEKSHDCYSLAGLLKWHTCGHDKWLDFCALVEKGDLKEAISLFCNTGLSNQPLSHCGPEVKDPGTGSP